MLLNVMENNSEMIYDNLPVKHDGCSIRYGEKKLSVPIIYPIE